MYILYKIIFSKKLSKLDDSIIWLHKKDYKFDAHKEYPKYHVFKQQQIINSKAYKYKVVLVDNEKGIYFILLERPEHDYNTISSFV